MAQPNLTNLIEEAYEYPALLTTSKLHEGAPRKVISMLDKGTVRAAMPLDSNSWEVNDWVKKAILLYFRQQSIKQIDLPPFEYRDKIPLKTDFAVSGARVVPPAVARFGSFLAKGVILMPSYVNIGAYVDEETMVDTWATVGTCAQIGKRVHLSGGVGIGGVLEPVQAKPVIVEDGCFIGSRCVVVEGVRIGQEAVLGANVVLTASTKIIDISGSQTVEYFGYIPPRCVVIPGSVPKEFPAGIFHVPAALIIGKRKPSTDLKTSLNDVLRDFQVPV